MPYRQVDPGVPTRRVPDPLEGDRKARKQLYNSAAWKRLRLLKLARDPLCGRCLEQGIVEPAAHVHHVEPLALRPDLALVLENLEGLCPSHHSTETRREQSDGPRP